MKILSATLASLVVCGCVATGGIDEAAPDIRITPDDPSNPAQVRFDVPASYVLGLPGDRIPTTLRARLSTREIAAMGLAQLSYCPRGFSGPDTVFAPDGDRSRVAFVVDCLAS